MRCSLDLARLTRLVLRAVFAGEKRLEGIEIGAAPHLTTGMGGA
jgi:hypothetical protein